MPLWPRSPGWWPDARQMGLRDRSSVVCVELYRGSYSFTLDLNLEFAKMLQHLSLCSITLLSGSLGASVEDTEQDISWP